MSTKEDEVYQYIVDYKMKRNGNSPSYDEIMLNCGISSKSAVKNYLDGLVKRNLITRNGVKSIEIANSEFRMKE